MPILRQVRRTAVLCLLLFFTTYLSRAQTLVSSYSGGSHTATSAPSTLTGGLTLSGGAVLVIDGVTTFISGYITINDGSRLEIRNGSDIGVSAAVTINAAGGKIIVDNSTLNSNNQVNIWTTGEGDFSNGSTVIARTINVARASKCKISNSTILLHNVPLEKGAINVNVDFNLNWMYSTPTANGGILEVTNSTIKGFQDVRWGGISVAGSNGASISQTGQKIRQGTVQAARAIFNGATIKDADWGVINWNNFDPLPSTGRDVNGLYTTGGIIQATNTLFKNNIMSAQFKPYQNVSATSALLKDASFFHGCTFEVGETSPPITYNGMIRMEGVYGLDILGCTFNNNSGLVGEAIRAHRSRFTVDGWCECLGVMACYATPTSPCVGGTYIWSTFNNTARAIYADNLMDYDRLVTIQHSRFNTIRECAITLLNCYKPKVWENEIALMDNGASQVKGIALGGCFGYTIHSNKIGSYGSVGKTYGILVNSSIQPFIEKVKLNTLGYTTANGPGSLAYALQSRGKNRDAASTYNGLKFFCNSMYYNTENSATDITVADLPGESYNGVSDVQGEIGAYGFGAQNIFAARANPILANSHLYNTTANPFVYIYGSGSGEDPVNRPATQIATPANSWKDCNSLGNGSGSGPGPVSKTYTEYLAARADLYILLSEPTVMDLNAETGYRAYDDLIAQYIDLTETMLDHYMRPEQTYTVVIDDETQETMYIPDTPVFYPDSIIMVLQGCEYLYPYKVALAGMYAQAGDYTSAYNELNAIPLEYTLTQEEVAAISDYATLLGVRESLEENEDDWDALAGGVQDWVRNAAENAQGTVRYMAGYFLARYENMVMIPEGWEREPEKMNEEKQEQHYALQAMAKGQGISIYPNPTTSLLNIDLQGAEGKAEAMLYDITGRTVLIQEVNGNGRSQINMKGLQPGSHILKLLRDGKTGTVHMVTKQ